MPQRKNNPWDWRKWTLETWLAVVGLPLGFVGIVIAAGQWVAPDFWKQAAQPSSSSPPRAELVPAPSARAPQSSAPNVSSTTDPTPSTSSTPPLQTSPPAAAPLVPSAKATKPQDSEELEPAFTFTTFDVVVTGATYPGAINSAGDIVGTYSGNGQGSFKRKRDGSVERFGYPNAASGTYATSINARGDIVGFYNDDVPPGRFGSPSHGFVRRADGRFISFDYPGSERTFAHGINDSGVIVGAYMDSEGLTHGFMRTADDVFVELRHPRALETFAYGINNRGQVVGHWRARSSAGGFAAGGRDLCCHSAAWADVRRAPRH